MKGFILAIAWITTHMSSKSARTDVYKPQLALEN